SAYVNRLLDRFSPTASDTTASINPFVRSHSPIAQFDQRLDFDDSIGFSDMPEAEQPAEFAAPSPTPDRIQRKATHAMAPASAPAIAPSAPAPASPRPSMSAPAVESSSAPDRRPVEASAPIASAAPIAAPRREPMDPGSLFDPFPRLFESEQITPLPSHSSPAPIELKSTPTDLEPRARVTPIPTTPTTPSTREPGPAREIESRQPSPVAPPWRPLERERPIEVPTLVPLVSPTRPREPGPSPQVVEQQAPAPIHHASPRPTRPAPFIPDPGPRARTDVDAASQ